MFARKSLESNTVGLNRFYVCGEAEITDGRIAWPAAILLLINIFSNPIYIFLITSQKI